MIGITNVVNKNQAESESVNISLITNQISHGDVLGATFTLTYGDFSKTYTWDGSVLTVSVPAHVNYTIAFGDVDGYRKPSDVTYTAQAGNSRTLNVKYETEVVSVTLNADNDASVSGAKVNINGKQHTWNGTKISQKVPFGTSYTVSVGELSGFSTPASKSFKAEQAVREVSFTYVASALKVNILSNQSTESSWDPTITNIKATVKYGSTTLQVSNGQQINLPSGVDVTISFPEVEGYLKPSDITFTHNGGLVEKSGTYQCELLTVNVSADQGSVSGFEVTISKQETVGVATKYTRLEYIEGDSDQRIDTGMKATNKTKIELKVSATSSHFFSGVGSSENRFGVYALTTGKLDIGLGSSGYLGSVISNITYPSVITLENGKATAGGSTYTFSTQSAFTTSSNLHIFSEGTGSAAGGRLYYYKVYENGTLVRDYIPALRSDGIVGLYDAVNDTFTASSGSGNFIAGGEQKETIATQTSVTGTYKIPFDTSYTIEASKVSGYNKPNPITRIASQKSYTANMQYAVITVVDLSLQDIYGNPINRSTANCYVVREAGTYKFPLVYGNAIKNGKVNTAAFTNNGGSNSHDFVCTNGRIITSPYVDDTIKEYYRAGIVNQDTENVVFDLSLEQGEGCLYIKFKVQDIPSVGANVLIGYFTPPGDPYWSWHIWLWPHDLTPVEITNATGVKYNIMPVNLASKYDSDGVHIKNWFYQWGRKEPMLLPYAWNSTADHSIGSITKSSKAEDLGTALWYPTTFYYNSNSPYNWFGDKLYYNLWDAACTTNGVSDNDTVKTVYDPCPVGWKIPNGNTFTGLSKISVANGIVKMRRYSGDTVGFGFPLSGCRHRSDGSIRDTNAYGYVFTSAMFGDLARGFTADLGSVNVNANLSLAGGYSIRPVQDDLTNIDVIMISFSIGRTTTTYQAESGMTWRDWVKSEYNTGGYYEKNGGISDDFFYVLDQDYHWVIPEDKIQGIQYRIETDYD